MKIFKIIINILFVLSIAFAIGMPIYKLVNNIYIAFDDYVTCLIPVFLFLSIHKQIKEDENDEKYDDKNQKNVNKKRFEL